MIDYESTFMVVGGGCVRDGRGKEDGGKIKEWG